MDSFSAAPNMMDDHPMMNFDPYAANFNANMQPPHIQSQGTNKQNIIIIVLSVLLAILIIGFFVWYLRKTPTTGVALPGVSQSTITQQQPQIQQPQQPRQYQPDSQVHQPTSEDTQHSTSGGHSYTLVGGETHDDPLFS